MKNKDMPAFPTLGDVSNTPQWSTEHGFTKREYFAGLAMQGFLSSYSGNISDPKAEHVAKKSLEYADALLLELSKPQP